METNIRQYMYESGLTIQGSTEKVEYFTSIYN